MDDITTPVLTEETPAPRVVDPASLEAALLSKDSTMGTPADIAAAFFQMNLPRLKSLLTTLSRRQVERAIICAAAYPHVPEGYQPRSREETQLARSIEQMVACKILMEEQVKVEKVDKAQKEVQTENETLIKGETNG